MKNISDRHLSAAASDSVLDQICDEIIEKLQEGDRVDMASLALEHPEYAEQLRRLLPALEALVDLGASSAQHTRQGISHGSISDPAPRVLGDYRILRELGRGGMGVVYEAEQRSLNRRVALKVLPMAAALDARQFQRFQLEAKAAACLHHNNIVPVFAVGTEGGVPYYAMQFIEGRSLAQVVAELRRAEGLDPAAPGPRANPLDDLTTTALAQSLIAGGTTRDRATGPGAVAETDAQPPQPAPDAKPASASTPASSPRAATGSSTHTRAYARTVAGLGLQAAEALDHAHTRGILHRDIKPGNLLLDAEGRLWVADFGLAQIQGSPSMTLSGDVLGTLRYMSPEQALGKRVVIDGRTDVYSLGVTLYELLALRPALDGKDRAEILRKIAGDDPAPLRRHNASVPTDLETIVRKAMAKEPAERYATAKDLADDLRCYLDDRPIRARRPSVLDRAAKWARRHTAIMTAASVILVLAMIGLATSTILITREQRRTLTALEQADTRLHLARKAVDEMYTQVAEKWIAGQPSLTQLQREFLEKAVSFYEKFAAEQAANPQLRHDAIRALYRAGVIRQAMGHRDEAETAFRQVVAFGTDLVREYPDRREFPIVLAEGRIKLVSLHRETGRFLPDDQGGEVHEAPISARALAIRPIDAEWELRQAGRELADLGKEVLTSAADRRRLAEALGALSGELTQVKRHPEANAVVRAAFSNWESLAREFPDDVEYRYGLARSYSWQGLQLIWWGGPHVREAEAPYREAEARLSKLQQEQPGDPRFRIALTQVVQNLLVILNESGRFAEAERLGRRALALIEGLAVEFPEFPERQQQLSGILTNLANAIDNQGQGRILEAEGLRRRAAVILEHLADRHPEVPWYHVGAWRALGDLSMTLYRLGKLDEARRVHEGRMRRVRAQVQAHPGAKWARSNETEFLINEVLFAIEASDRVAAVRIAEEWATQVLNSVAPDQLGVKVVRLCESQDPVDPRDTPAATEANAVISTCVINEALHRGLDDPHSLSRLSIWLSAAPEARREPELALRFARRAMEQKPDDEWCLEALGWALYRVGDWKGCIAALEKQASYPQQGDFFAAMAHGRLGDTARSLSVYNLADTWLQGYEKHCEAREKTGVFTYPHRVVLRRIRAEAAALLGPSPPASNATERLPEPGAAPK